MLLGPASGERKPDQLLAQFKTIDLVRGQMPRAAAEAALLATLPGWRPRATAGTIACWKFIKVSPKQTLKEARRIRAEIRRRAVEKCEQALGAESARLGVAP